MFLVLILISIAMYGQNVIDNQPVSYLDLNRYLGLWYEIARFDHSFEKDLVGVTARYSLNDDGMIRVENRGFMHTLNGKEKVAIGKAKIVTDKPGQLKVSFFLWFYADYNVLMIDNNYSYVLIGSKSPDYLWILSRTPEMDPVHYNAILAEAKKRGYNTSRLLQVLQK
ncbi:MAG: lipocalin family protein [Bacteroidales bacterium]